MFGDTKEIAKAIVGKKDADKGMAGDDSGKEDAAEELMAAIQSADAAGVVTAFKALFDLLESEPHEEFEEGE